MLAPTTPHQESISPLQQIQMFVQAQKVESLHGNFHAYKTTTITNPSQQHVATQPHEKIEKLINIHKL
jgi:hypothetical protein